MSSTPTVTAAASPSRQPLIQRRPVWRRLLQIVAWGLVGIWSLLLIAWLTLHWGILTHIEQWRPRIEQGVGHALGVPVRIGRIEVRSGGWLPALEMRDVVLFDAQQREALRLPSVSAALSPRSLLAFELRLSQLLLDKPDLDVRVDPQGRLTVGGLSLGGPASATDDGAAMDWFFGQHEFAVRGGTLRWTDERRAAPPLALSDVNIVVRNGLRHHDMRIDATPPDDWGTRFSVRGKFTQPLLARPGDWRRWSGRLHAQLPRGDVRQLRRHAELPFELSEGEGALRAWLEVRAGQPRELTLDLAVRAVALRLSPSVEPLAFEQMEGRLVARRTADGVLLRAQNFGFVTGDGVRWPRGDLQLSWRQAENDAVAQPITGGEFSAQRLDLGLMAQIASRIPVGKAVRGLLAELAPQGVVSALAARWDGPLDAPLRYEVKSKFSGLSLAARPSSEPGGIGRPGLHLADIDLAATEKGGTARLELSGGALELPGVLEDPLIPLASLSSQLAWTVTPGAGAASAPQIEVRVQDARFANADVTGAMNATWRTGPGQGLAQGGRYPGVLDLDASLSQAQAARAARYLPLGLPEEVRHYVARAITGGTLSGATLRIKGDLWDFPFYNARQGEFRFAAKVQDASFAYVPSVPGRPGEAAWESPWPALTKVRADLVFDRATMEVRNGQARIEGFELSAIQGGIRNLAEHSVLVLEGAGHGALGDGLRFINRSPVGAWTAEALKAATASGNAELKLALNIPLFDVDRSSVKGSVLLGGNDVRLRPDTPLLADARGRIDFTQRSFAIAGGSARLLGGEASFEGGLQADGSLRFAGQGLATAEGLRKAGELGALSRLAQSLSGQAAYRLALGFVQGQPEIEVTSNLVGLASELPAPLRKAADSALALHYQTSFQPEPAGAPAARETLRLELGTLLQAQYLREWSGDTARVLRGGIGVMEPAPWPAQGVQAHLSLPSLDADAWEAVGRRLLGSPAPAGAPGPAPVEEGAGYLPGSIALRVQALRAGSRELSRVVAGVSRDDDVWRANLDADQLNGYVEYRPARRAGGASTGGLVHARLSRLVLPKSDVESVESMLDQQPASIPALDIVVDDFQLRGKHLGRVQIEAVNRGVDGARDLPREWRLTRFDITTPEAQLTASGDWVPVAPGGTGHPAAAARRRATMNFQLDVSDSGALLDRLGLGRPLRGGKGRLSGQVAWLGSPLSPDVASLTGQLNLALQSGQFLKVNPGAARLLGVLSLQALPRRLLFDFRDVFEEGFAFDSVTGDVAVLQGVASTNNLRMRGVQAVVLMEGQADLDAETQDLRVVVVPEINAGTASLAFAAINPAVGLGTFLAQVFLRKPMMQAATREFHVTGTWGEPKMQRVQRKLTDPIPNIDAPAAAASAPAMPP